LPALLAGKVVGKSLQFVEHNVLDVIVIEHGFKQETVMRKDSILVVAACCLVKQSLACSLLA